MFALLAQQFPGIDGFLGTRASIMLDVVVLSMAVVLPVLYWSIAQVKRGRFALHKRVQVIMAAVLFVAVLAFEIDMRFISGWEKRAEPSPYFAGGAVWTSLKVHLVFSISTLFVWIYVLAGALKNFADPPVPNAYSPWHKFWGWIATVDLTLTAVSGWVFYWLAFAA